MKILISSNGPVVPVLRGQVPGDPRVAGEADVGQVGLLQVGASRVDRADAGPGQPAAGVVVHQHDEEHARGGFWTTSTLPPPADAAANQFFQVNGVSSPSVAQCVAIGSYGDTAGDEEGLLLTGSG